MQEVKRTDLETKKLQQRWERDGCLVCVRLFQTFSFCSVFASVSCFFFPLRLCHSLYWFLHFLFPCSVDFMCRKNGAKTESQSLLLPCFSSLFFVFSFLFFLFYCLPSWSHSHARMKEETPSVLCVFFSPNCLPLLHFLSFFSCFSAPPFFFPSASLLSPPLLPRSLEGLIT